MPWKTVGRLKQRSLGPSDPRTPTRHTTFGITAGEFAAILAAQGGRCAGCGTTTPGGVGWSLDHDHTCAYCSGAGCRRCVRSILCPWCNNCLAQARDNPETLRRLADYLEKRGPR